MLTHSDKIENLKNSLKRKDFIEHLKENKQLIELLIEVNLTESIAFCDEAINKLSQNSLIKEVLDFKLLKVRSLNACYQAIESENLCHSILSEYNDLLSDKQNEELSFYILANSIQLKKEEWQALELEKYYHAFKNNNNYSKLLEVIGLFSQYYIDQNNIKSIEYALEGMTLSQNENRKLFVVLFSGLLFNLQQKIGDNKGALVNYEIYFNTAYELGLYNRIMLSSRLAVMVAKKLNDIDKIKKYTDAGISLGYLINSPMSLTVALDLLDKTADIDKAITLANEIKLKISTCSNLEKSLIHFCLAKLYIQINQLDEALVYLNILAQELEAMPRVHDKIKTVELLIEVYEKGGQYQLAFEWLKKLKDLQLDDYNIELNKSINELNIKYQSEKKEAEYQKLQNENLRNELNAIKSQLNPHFLFNVLGTIQNLVTADENEKANDALSSFTKMMRNILEHSNEENITIDQEISLLKSYCNLEKLYLGDDFTFDIKVDENLDIDFDSIPSMLLQPIVENAIKHGLKHKIGAKHLVIDFQRTQDGIKISVDDNGVGRDKSAEINKTFRKNHKSFATSASQRRIELLNSKAGFEKMCITITDKKAGDKCEGTRVEFVSIDS